ncbi:hypothetical protein C0J52_01572 [Blattella germanica]|nr:hypothetical protein C0J52_01572 [Blattella germanica]
MSPERKNKRKSIGGPDRKLSKDTSSVCDPTVWKSYGLCTQVITMGGKSVSICVQPNIFPKV